MVCKVTWCKGNHLEIGVASQVNEVEKDHLGEETHEQSLVIKAVSLRRLKGTTRAIKVDKIFNLPLSYI